MTDSRRRWLLALAGIVGEAARVHRIDPLLAWAIVMQESRGKVSAYRYEPGWRYFTDTHGAALRTTRELAARLLSPTEFHTQSASWGPMQVMGSVARELGYRGMIPDLLVSPAVALDLGCRKLAALIAKYDGSLEDAISAYNDGDDYTDLDNEAYVVGVMGYKRGAAEDAEMLEALGIQPT